MPPQKNQPRWHHKNSFSITKTWLLQTREDLPELVFPPIVADCDNIILGLFFFLFLFVISHGNNIVITLNYSSKTFLFVVSHGYNVVITLNYSSKYYLLSSLYNFPFCCLFKFDDHGVGWGWGVGGVNHSRVLGQH